MLMRAVIQATILRCGRGGVLAKVVLAIVVAVYSSILGSPPSHAAEQLAATAYTLRGAPSFKAGMIIVRKQERRLYLISQDGAPLKSYRVALGFQPYGAKRWEGDGRTPEGIYTIDGRNPDSRFHRSLRISYPNALDLERSAAAGYLPGGDIVIHGIGDVPPSAAGQHPNLDWTEGCIAVTNAEIEEIWRAVDDGTPIAILP